ncbi:threonine aldolase [Nocardioides luteus]|uniref:L-threonine aldolase n=1 Tax=Nocardioides luteus TaxID=1844 RepID=A0ABQ5T2U8_9ACTN|nr:beta-eliminating lyase-related protein [Nocardioides luteus]MDR7310426.1 threonine aldolase [Nocardioides luteus]GGR52797.1 L-threonine aldolase [Nocardioides luteus]GLJ69794.1 L-threonine aldolase [Nocardioides luteus]
MTVELRSDNAAAVSPAILEAMAAVNSGSALAYGGDEVTAALEARVREVFDHPSARVFPVLSGTAANALSLSAMTPPWGSVVCHETAHILASEGGATSFLSGGAVMTGVAGEGYKIAPEALQAQLDGVRWGDPHNSQPAVLALTSPSDYGTVYSVEEIAELTAIAKTRDLRVHLDGARFANAVVATGAAPADLTWRAGVDVLSLGATKNGALSAEAIVCFTDAPADELVYRTKRSGHVTSKMRYQSAQLLAYLTDDLWLHNARNANERMAELAGGLEKAGVRITNSVDANLAWVDMPEETADRLEAAGVLFYRLGGQVRFVTSWQTSAEDVSTVLAALGRA